MMVLPATAAPEKAPRELEGGWVYAWGDEFNGTKLNTKKWAYELGVVRNPGASQAYTKDCVRVKNGKLQLISRAKPTPNCHYKEGSSRWMEKIKTQPFASGSVTTRGVKHFEAPGRLEFRARVPKPIMYFSLNLSVSKFFCSILSPL